jgi:hypothetical protein
MTKETADKRAATFVALTVMVADGFFDEERAVGETGRELERRGVYVTREMIRACCDDSDAIGNVGTPAFNVWIKRELVAEVRQKQANEIIGRINTTFGIPFLGMFWALTDDGADDADERLITWTMAVSANSPETACTLFRFKLARLCDHELFKDVTDVRLDQIYELPHSIGPTVLGWTSRPRRPPIGEEASIVGPVVGSGSDVLKVHTWTNGAPSNDEETLPDSVFFRFERAVNAEESTSNDD